MVYYKHMSTYTKKFLERLYFNLPPLVPTVVQTAMEKTMEEIASEPASIQYLEDLIIAFSKKVWPYNQAFEELTAKYNKQMGEKLLLQKASYGLRRAVVHYHQTGGSWDALYTGAVAILFTLEERVELHQILVDINCDVRAFARQAALTVDRARYEERIDYYAERLQTIENELGRLRVLANSEMSEFLAREINQQVRAFELGIAAIGPKVDYSAVCNAHEHFVGRIQEFKTRVF